MREQIIDGLLVNRDRSLGSRIKAIILGKIRTFRIGALQHWTVREVPLAGREFTPAPQPTHPGGPSWNVPVKWNVSKPGAFEPPRGWSAEADLEEPEV